MFDISTFAKEWLPLILTSAIAICSMIFSYEAQLKGIRKDSRIKEIEVLEKQLYNFYYPFLLLSRQNTNIYKIFALKQKKEIPDYRTLTYLLEGKKFDPPDTLFLEQILSNDEKLDCLILDKASLVTNDDLRKKLSEASTHYTLIRMVHKNGITSDRAEYSVYVHPNDLLTLIENEVARIEERIRVLREEI